MKKIILLLTPLAFLLSCSSAIEEQKFDSNYFSYSVPKTGGEYINEELKWKINIPYGWEKVTDEQRAEDTKKSMDIVKEETGIDVDISDSKPLLSLKKNRNNYFLATTRPYTEEYKGEFNDSYLASIKLMEETYINYGIDVVITPTIQLIDGLEFLATTTEIYSKKRELIATQLNCSRLFNDKELWIMIQYNNELDKAILIETMESSKFN